MIFFSDLLFSFALHGHRSFANSGSECAEKTKQKTFCSLLPCCPRLYSQHVPTVLTVADTSYSVGLFFGEADTDLWVWSLPSIFTHISDGAKKGLSKYNNPHTLRDEFTVHSSACSMFCFVSILLIQTPCTRIALCFTSFSCF